MDFLAQLKNIKSTKDTSSTQRTDYDQFFESVADGLDELEKSNPEKYKELMGSGFNSIGQPPLRSIQPISGFVVKTRIVSVDATVKHPPAIVPKAKVFVNLCHSPELPEPPLASAEEIQKVMSGDTSINYKIPLSLIGPYSSTDRAGQPCLVFDACLNSVPLAKSEKDLDYGLFLVELALEWVESKNKIVLSRDFHLPRIKSKGILKPHHIPFSNLPPPAPLTPTLIPSTAHQGPVKISAIPKFIKDHSPTYELSFEPPPPDVPNFIVLTVLLPLVASTSVAKAVLDVSAGFVDLIAEIDELNRYCLHLPFLGYELDQEQAGAEFDRSTQMLTVTMPLHSI